MQTWVYSATSDGHLGAFLTLVGKVPPKDIRAEVQPSENLKIQVVLV